MAIDGEHAATVVEVIGMLGLDCQIVRNRAAVMVLPAGVTKGTGLGTVLAEMNLSLHDNHRLVGIVSEADIARHLPEHAIAQFVKAICAPQAITSH